MIKVLEKVDAVFDEIRKTEGAAFSGIREATGINKSTLSQILKSMSELDWVRRDAEGKFFAGEKLASFAREELGRESLRNAVNEAVTRLAGEIGGTASASVLLGSRRVRIARTYGNREILVDDEHVAGGKGSVLGTATGRLLFAFQTECVRQKILREDGVKMTPEIKAELDGVRRSGIAKYLSPNLQVKSMAGGIFSSGRILAAIGIAVPEYQCSALKEKEYERKIRAAARFAEELLQL